jgi:tetratricopeptide (TPR) repeat protein
VYRASPKIGRNQLCPCGSGKKYKKCCLGRHDGAAVDRIDLLMQEGYRLSAARDTAGACQVWDRTWQLIRARFDPTMRTCEEAGVVFTGTQLLFNWVQDFCMELLNAALDDPSYAEMGIRFCHEVLAQFTHESDSFTLNFRADLGELYGLAGRLDEGQKTFLDLIRDRPVSALGYVRLAELLAQGVGRQGQPIDLDRARELLEQALEKPDADDFDVALRLADLRRSSEAAPPA